MTLRNLLLPLLVTACVSPASVATARPNVLIIMPDDVSWDDFSFHRPSGPRTPRIDALARTSVRLDDFHVSPTCSPTRAALLTGRYSNATGVWHTILGRYFLRADEPTLGDIFRANGYRTAPFGKWHLGDHRPFRPKERGFDHTAMHLGGGIDQQPNPWGNRDVPPATLFVDGQPQALVDEDDGMNGAYSTNFFTNRALGFIRARHAAREPFFAYLAYNIAHAPFDVPPDARAGIDARTAIIENLDQNLGRVLGLLDELGIRDDTVVVFLTDNGMTTRGLRGGKASHYEGGHRVPCFVRWPAGGIGGTPGQAGAVPHLAAHIDVLPTLMDLLGLRDVPRTGAAPLHGASLRTLLDADPHNDDPSLRERVLVVDNQRMVDLVEQRQASVMQDAYASSGAIAHKWRLASAATPGTWELYDVLADPRQEHDRAGEPALAGLIAALGDAYAQWWREVSRRAAEHVRPVLAHPDDGEVCLLSHDWQVEGMVPWNHTMVAEGFGANGFHAVEFARVTAHRFELRRWPRELAEETTLTSALARPLPHARDNRPILGEAQPIRGARLRIWHGTETYFDARTAVAADADAAVFAVARLPAGPASVQTWFYDNEGREIAGACYVYVSSM